MTAMSAQALAAEQLETLGRRWLHVRAVGLLADVLASQGDVSMDVRASAWLHDIGYAPSVVRTGFHPLDGARFLQSRGVTSQVVALVAHHTGAVYEAEERGLADELAGLPRPNRAELDALTLLDLVVGPGGDFTTPEDRVDEILSRYGADDPVHRAITRSGPELLESARRARARLRLADEWPRGVAESVLEA